MNHTDTFHPEKDTVNRSEREAAGLSTSHNFPQSPSSGLQEGVSDNFDPICQVHSAVGGSTSILDLRIPNKIRRRIRTGGGIKGRIKAFSRSSRNRLLRLGASINLEALTGPVLWITLTYPSNWPDDSDVWNTHLQNWRKRLERRLQKMYGTTFPAIWRFGFQRRNAPHFHLLIFTDSSFSRSNKNLREFRDFVAQSWYETCGRLCEEHRVSGTRVDRIWASNKKAIRKKLKYIAKREEIPEPSLAPGRFWGAWNKELLPVTWSIVNVGYRAYLYIRRVFRKQMRRRRGCGILRKCQVFMEFATVKKLLKFLGYDTN